MYETNDICRCGKKIGEKEFGITRGSLHEKEMEVFTLWKIEDKADKMGS